MTSFTEDKFLQDAYETLARLYQSRAETGDEVYNIKYALSNLDRYLSEEGEA